MQTCDRKLRQKALQENQESETLIKVSISQEQAKKKEEYLPNGEAT